MMGSPWHLAQRALRYASDFDVVVRQGPAILELLPSKNQTLLIRRNPFLVLHLGFHDVDGVRRLSLAAERRQQIEGITLLVPKVSPMGKRTCHASTSSVMVARSRAA